MSIIGNLLGFGDTTPPTVAQVVAANNPVAGTNSQQNAANFAALLQQQQIAQQNALTNKIPHHAGAGPDIATLKRTLLVHPANK